MLFRSDHINVFPEYEKYFDQFKLLTQNMAKNAIFIYNQNDPECVRVSEEAPPGIKRISYTVPDYKTKEGHTILKIKQKEYKTSLFGKHNMENISAALNICRFLGIREDNFFEFLLDFKGAARRQELIFENKDSKVFFDFAHAPSKVKATVEAFREFFPDRKLITILELHTYSSLNKKFIPEYHQSLQPADNAIVYFDPEVLKSKNLPFLDQTFIKRSFGQDDLQIFTQTIDLQNILKEKIQERNTVIVIMTSGNLGGIQLQKILHL